jgi:hypothetical protein
LSIFGFNPSKCFLHRSVVSISTPEPPRLYIKQHQTYGLTSTLLASAPGWSGNTINHSNFSAAEEVIVLFKPLDVNLDIGVKVDDLERVRERRWKDMSRRMRTGRTW